MEAPTFAAIPDFRITWLSPWLIHGGTARQDGEKATVLPWNDHAPLLELIS